MEELWLGTEDSHRQLQAMDLRFSAPEYLALWGVEDEEPTLDKDFSVMSDRKGLTVLERFGEKAVLKVHGSLTPAYASWHKYVPGYVTSYEAIKDALDIVANERGITEVIADFATSGGSVRGLEATADAFRRVNKIKPVYGHTDSHAFSAGYWLASSTRKFSASRMAEVGSIGTLMIITTQVKAAEQAGYEYHVFRAGKFKAVGNPYEHLSEEHREYLQANLEKTNSFFLEHVSKSRNLLMSDRAAWGEGQTFFAEEGIKAGLVDRVATLADLLGSAASAKTTIDNRRFEMPISAEKLAQIAAGADPKEVLTAEELKHYMASLENAGGGSEGGDGEEEEGDGDDTPSTEVPSDVLKLTKEVGRLEVKLEAAEEKLVEAQARLAAVQAESDALIKVAQVAVGNLQKALGLPRAEKSSATEVLAQFNELQGKMAQMFPVGQRSTTPTDDSEEPKASASFRNQPAN